jgi:hypothetical protein
VRLRVLDEVWSSSLADGSKRVETQRYSTLHSGNAMKFATAGEVIVFGTSSGPHGIAMVAGPSTKALPADQLGDVLKFVSNELHDALHEYMEGYAVFDYMLFSNVWDIRDLGMSWTAFALWTGATLPRNRQGFPKLIGSNLKDKLLTLASENGVSRPQS